jgi:DNA/RNA-binding domain of Phe-tRNA-synthetase-like protein
MPFAFGYAPELLTRFPSLAAHAMVVDGIGLQKHPALDPARPFLDLARQRLAGGPEGEWPEIKAWRRAFGLMGLKPTQYRCAAEALLRRLRKEGGLPRVHPLVDLCNAVSVAYAAPIAVFDLAHVEGGLLVRRADGSERYLAFNGEIEHPDPGEVIFADAAGRAHARRWTHRQSAESAIRPDTRRALVVAEALHEQAGPQLKRLATDLHAAVAARWPDAAMTELPFQPAARPARIAAA